MNRHDRAADVAHAMVKTIEDILLNEVQLDVGEALAVMQMVARSLQATVDAHTLLSVKRFEGIPYSRTNGRDDEEQVAVD